MYISFHADPQHQLCLVRDTNITWCQLTGFEMKASTSRKRSADIEKEVGTVNMVSYYQMLIKLKSAIQIKISGLFSDWVLFLDDNTRPHTVWDTAEHICHL
ncbi:hypothetical protein J437_LFUL009798 [Ladona fulva]|uniref:Uncharacterized protein n=1 Tax=Ladona fulva TaxID=123851 RepID=A0A8K0K8C7_LADFU|nr:hypothetical protein J437_LFUL009798 [Ladona fulva]